MTVSAITPNLWMGSKPPTHDPRVGRMWDLVVLCAEEHQPKSHEMPGVQLLRVKLDDPGMTETQRLQAIRTGEHVASVIRRGGKVLVTCQMGINRSGLVCGIALVAMGHSAGSAIALIRARRGKQRIQGGSVYALFNKRFCDVLTEYARRKGRTG